MARVARPATERSHVRGVREGGLTIYNSKHLRARAQARMYDHWGSLNKYSAHFDSEHCSQPIPVGRVRSKRSYQVPRPEKDHDNFYQSCALITPGPGSFDAVVRQNGIGQDMRTFRPIFDNRGFGSGDRPCLKQLPETSPGPGAYDMSGLGVYGTRSPPFLTISKQHKTPELEGCMVMLKTLLWRIARIKEAADVNSRMPAGKRRVLQVEGKNLKAMEAKAQEIRQVIRSIREYQEYERSLGTRYSKAAHLAGDRTRTKSHPFSNQTDRFAPDIRTTPACIGPATYCPESILLMGNEASSKGVRFDSEVRPCGADAPVSKSFVTVRLDNHGHAYFADLTEPGPSEYAPPNFPRRGLLYDPCHCR